MSHSNPHPAPAPTSDARPRSLVMDDDPLFRTLLVSMLKRDYQVAAACDGSDGFYKALECPPDVAVVDVQMPVWDGLRTISAFREHAALKSVPLLVLTSDASQETVLAAIAAGADDYVIKSSLSRDELLRKLARVRHHRRRQADHEADAPPERRLQEVIDAWE